jgi:hypothetical protein
MLTKTSFAIIPTDCARQFRRHPDRVEDRRPDTPHRDRAPPRTRQQDRQEAPATE